MGANASMLLGRAVVSKEMLPFTTWSKKKVELMKARHHHDLAGTFALGPRQFCILLGLNEEKGVPLFRKIFDTDKNNLVDAFEAMGAITVLATMTIQEKVDFIHALYDFNGTGDLTVDEMTILLRTIAVACEKMDPKVVAPATAVCAEWARAWFLGVGRDLEGEVAKHEFDRFCAARPEVAAFLEYWQGGVGQVVVPPGGLFEDPGLPAGGAALYYDEARRPAGLSPPEAVRWLRPREMVGEDCRLFAPAPGGAEGDLRQGQLADLWLANALACLAGHPALLRRLFVPTGQEDVGRYCVQFFKWGNWANVYVDDRLPCDRLRRPLFLRPAGEEEVWAALLEKAYAKLHGGRYEALLGGRPEYALRDLTGGAVAAVAVDPARKRTVAEADAAWATLCARWERGVVGVCRRVRARDAQDAVAAHKLARTGLLQNHCYSVAQVLESEGHRLVKLRNPWGQGDFQGAWAKSGDLWDQNPDTAKAARFSRAPDGAFWMSFQEFLGAFNTMYVARLPENDWGYARREGRFPKLGGGCTNGPTWTDQEQFFLQITEEDTELVLGLTQEDDKLAAAAAGGGRAGAGDVARHIGLLVHAADGVENLEEAKKVCELKQVMVEGMTLPFEKQRDISLTVTLQPGFYAVIPMTFEPDQPGAYVLTAQGSKPFQLKGSNEIPGSSDELGAPSVALEKDVEARGLAAAADPEDGKGGPEGGEGEGEEDGQAQALAHLGATVAELYSLAAALRARKEGLEERVAALKRLAAEDD